LIFSDKAAGGGIGGNVNETGRDKAFIKTLAGMLRIRFDELWQRYEKEKIEEERRKREERNRLQLIQSRFLAEKATDLADRGDSYLARLLALQALPKRLGDPEDRPYCPEAEAAPPGGGGEHRPRPKGAYRQSFLCRIQPGREAVRHRIGRQDRPRLGCRIRRGDPQVHRQRQKRLRSIQPRRKTDPIR